MTETKVRPRLEVRLFGAFAVRRDDVDVTSTLPGRKGRAVVAYLASRYPGDATRSELLDVGWSDTQPNDPRANLRTLLSRIRDVLGPEALTDGERIGLAGASVETDLRRVAGSVEGARQHRTARRAQEAVRNARAAVDVLDLGFLRDLDGEWIDQLRRSFENDLSDMLSCIADMGSLAGGALADEAIAAARELVERDGYLERGHAHLILALARSGERAEALRAYEAIRRQLRDELGASPGPELQALHATILRSDEPGGRGSGGTPQVPGLRRREDIRLPPSVAADGSAFVGRQQELDLIRPLIVRNVAEADGSHIVALAGPPGIGKSTLARRVGALAGEAGSAVLFGRCDEDFAVPYQPFREAIGHLVRSLTPEGREQLLGSVRPDLARIVPELAEGGSLAVSAEETDTRRYRLLDSVAILLRELATTGPVLWIIDDVQWADQATQLMMRHVERAVRDLPVTFLVTIRDTAADHGEGFDGLLGELLREREIVTVALRGLDRDSVHELCDLRSTGAAPAELVDVIHHRSGGNPLFARELIRDALDRIAPVGAARDGGSLDDWPVPDTVQQLVLRRLSKLSDDERDLMLRASTLGPTFLPIELAAAAECPAAQALAAIERATAAGFLVPPAGEDASSSFSHPLMREALRATLSPARRAQLHFENAERLELYWGAAVGEHIAEVAHHRLAAAEAGIEREASVDWAIRAAADAERHLAHEVAAGLYARAIALLPGSPSRRAEQARLLLRLAAAQWRSGQREHSRATRRAAFDLAAQVDDLAAMTDAATGHERYFETDVLDDTDRLMVEEALARATDVPMRAQLMARLSLVDHWTGDEHSVRKNATEAVALARDCGDDEVLAAALNALLFAMRIPGSSVDERLTMAAELVEVARRTGSDERRLEGEAHRLVAIVEAGRTTEVRAAIERFGRVAEGVRQPFWRYYHQAWAATLALIEGDVDRAERLDEIATTTALGARGDAADGDAAARIQRAVEEGNASAVASLAAQLVADGTHDGVWKAANAMILAFAGETERARAALRDLVRPDGLVLTRDLLWGLGACILADAAYLIGDADSARTVGAELAAAPRAIVCSGRSFLLVSQRLGQIAQLEGDFDGALAHFEVARQQGADLGAHLVVAWADLETAATLLLRGKGGDVDLAGELLASVEAFAAGSRLGLLQGRVSSVRSAFGLG